VPSRPMGAFGLWASVSARMGQAQSWLRGQARVSFCLARPSGPLVLGRVASSGVGIGKGEEDVFQIGVFGGQVLDRHANFAHAVEDLFDPGCGGLEGHGQAAIGA